MQEIRLTLEIDHSLCKVITQLDLIRNKVRNFTLSSKNGKVSTQTLMQTVFAVKPIDQLDRSVLEIILSHALKAETSGVGAFDNCIKTIAELTQRYHKHSIDTKVGVTTLEEIVSLLQTGASPARSEDIDWVVNRYSPLLDHTTSEMVKEAIKLAGFAGRVIIEKTPSQICSVELVRGYTFDCKPCWSVSARFERCRVVCVDGLIESVGEVHALLEIAAQLKETILLVARGINEDVKHTLKVNYDRGTLRVIPFVVQFDLNSLNTLKDIAVVCGEDVVSSLKGELISSIDVRNNKLVDEALVNPEKLIIVNRSSKQSVATHVAHLREKRKDMFTEDAGFLIDTRVRSLSPSHVVMRLPDNSDFVVKCQSIDYALRAIKQLVEHGTVVINGEKTLTTTAIATATHSKKCFEILGALDAFMLTSD